MSLAGDRGFEPQLEVRGEVFRLGVFDVGVDEHATRTGAEAVVGGGVDRLAQRDRGVADALDLDLDEGGTVLLGKSRDEIDRDVAHHELCQLRDALTKRVGEPGVASLFEIVEVDRIVDVVEAIEVAPADRHGLAAGFDRRCHS